MHGLPIFREPYKYKMHKQPGRPHQHPNPFSDVDTDSWAYQAISSLSDQNIVEGYPDGTFRGNKHLTRYELAQVVARLMAKSDRLSAEQQAVVGKLAGEYKDELTDLGVRVAALEKKTGRTSLITELRVHGVNRYYNVFKDKKESHFETGARVRLNTITRVNDRNYLYGQLQTHRTGKSQKRTGADDIPDQ